MCVIGVDVIINIMVLRIALSGSKYKQISVAPEYMTYDILAKSDIIKLICTLCVQSEKYGRINRSALSPVCKINDHDHSCQKQRTTLVHV